MARTPLLPGWERIPGGGDVRRYRDPSGHVHTRREYDNARAKAAGFNDYNKALQFSKEQRGNVNFENAVNAAARNQGKKPAELRRFDSSFMERFRRTFYKKDAQGNYVEKNRGRMSTRARGPLAKWLEGIGARPSGASYPVGNSPRLRGRGMRRAA